MFQWSSSRRGGNASSTSTSTTTAPTVRGSVRPPSISRRTHIDSYMLDPELKNSTRRVSADDTLFDTVFTTVSKVTLMLRVSFPYADSSGTGNIVPSMSLVGAEGRHPWLNGNNEIVGYSPIRDRDAWEQSGMSLGSAVKAVVQHLQLQPPTNVHITDAGLQKIQPVGGPATFGSPSSSFNHQPPESHPSSRSTSSRQFQNSSSNDSKPPPQYNPPRTPDIDMPAIPSRFSELDSMTLAELEVLQSDDLSFLAFCNRLESTQSCRTIASSVLGDNAEQAEKHLQKEEQVKQLKAEIASTRSELEDAVRNFQTLETKQDLICAPPDVQQVRKDLDVLKRQTFRESEELADAWTEDGEPSVDAFLKEFLKLRTVHHQLAAKHELVSKMPAS